MEYINFIFQETYKILFLLVPVLVSVAMIVWLDRRVWAFVQKRQGPNVVGPFGLLQSLADALKYIFKDLFVQLLEGLHADEAELLVASCNRKLQDNYRVTQNVVAEAFPAIEWGNRG